jgi:hypothetical protein
MFLSLFSLLENKTQKKSKTRHGKAKGSVFGKKIIVDSFLTDSG